MEKEEIINLIKGRIEDEYYKHPLIDLSTIAAIKIYNECFKYFNNQNQELQKDMADKIKEAYEQGLKDGYACMPSTINPLNKQD